MSLYYKQKFLDVLKLIHKLEPSPGFSQALGTTFHDLTSSSSASSSSIQVEDKGSTVRVELPVNSALYIESKSITLSTYMAIMDDLTTYSLMTVDGGRPGVSVFMNMETTGSSLSSVERLAITARTRKVGRNLGFTSAEIRDAATNRMICHGSHIKFLPMGFLADYLLQYGWPVIQWWYGLSHFQPPVSAKERLSLHEVMSSFDTNTGSFRVKPHHASLGGPIHGGCQAVLMEMAASTVAESTLPGCYLQSISIEYLAKPSCPLVDTQVRVVHQDSYSLTLEVLLLCNGKTKAEGILKYMKMDASSKL